MASTFIYALCEPDTRKVRYIGKANDPLKRLGLHLSVSVTLDTHLGHWLSKLRTSGMKPILSVLREVPEEIWQEEEIGYIRQARELGMNLVNGNDGGIGGHNPTPETKEKKRVASSGTRNGMFGRTGRESPRFGSKNTPEQLRMMDRTGFRHSEETLARMSESQKGKKNAMFGKIHSKISRAKISEARLAGSAFRKLPSFSDGGGI